MVLARLAGEIFPAGVLNVVLGTGETGAMMVEHKVPGLVSITGSVRAGIAVAAGAAKGLKRADRKAFLKTCMAGVANATAAPQSVSGSDKPALETAKP